MPPIVCFIAARSGTGKTTLLETLIRELSGRGYRIGAIKNDAHSFEIDSPGKDTWRFAQAGAHGVAIISSERFALIQRTKEHAQLEAVAARFDPVDLILVEGFKTSSHPKIEIVRQAHGTRFVSPAQDLLAIVTDLAVCPPPYAALPKFGLTDSRRLADFLVARFLS